MNVELLEGLCTVVPPRLSTLATGFKALHGGPQVAGAERIAGNCRLEIMDELGGFGLVEQRQLGRVGLDGLLGLAIEQTVAQQLDLFFKIDDLAVVDRALDQQLRKQLFERSRVVRKVIGH